MLSAVLPNGQTAPVATPDYSPLAVAIAFRPPPRPAGVTRAAAAVQAERARGSVCSNPQIQGEALSRIDGPGACGISHPVRVRSVAGVRLSTPATIDCQTAQALARWVQRSAIPAIGNTGGGLAGLRVVSHYSCRTRNSQPGARLSEHSFGRAIDIAGFQLRNGTEISVLNGWNSSNGARLRRMHDQACGTFGTVLGPNANRFHADHFHFDTANYRSGSYCR
ncbi:MAG: extensin family protein [Rhodobacteraceae bacterium]|nr:extensin family protein [Paracoccaceae bacterium]